MREKLALFQTGQSSAGEAEPFFLAGQIIEKARAKSNAQDKLSTIKERSGLVVHALCLTTRGSARYHSRQDDERDQDPSCPR